MRVPVCDIKRQFDAQEQEIRQAINTVLESGWYIHGPQHEAFEAEFAAYVGRRHCVAVANGTDALELALRSVGVGPGALVATVANAGMYSTYACTAVGATPVYVDVTAQLTMSPASLETTIAQNKLAAVVVTHLHGQLAEIESLAALARQHGIAVVEDVAQAHGARRNGLLAGSFGDVAAFSFYPTKNLGAIGDGGALLCEDDTIAAVARSLRQYGWERKYVTTRSGGRNSRLDELQAAILRVKLPSLDGWNQTRRSIVSAYRDASTGTALRFVHQDGDDYVAHLAVARHPDREAFRARLHELGVDTAIHYPICDHRQPVFSGSEMTETSLPSAEVAEGEIVTLPCFPEMTSAEIDRVCEAIRRVA